MTYTLSYEGGTEDFESLDDAVSRGGDLGIAGVVVYSLEGPEGFHPLDIVDEDMYRKLDAADPNVDPASTARETGHGIPPPRPHPMTGLRHG